MLLNFQIDLLCLVVMVACVLVLLFLIHRVLLRLLVNLETIRLTMEAHEQQDNQQRNRYGAY